MHLRYQFSDLIEYCKSLILKINPLDDNQKFIRKLIGDGFQINAAYDIGAYKGLWTRKLKYVIPDAEFILFEANAAHEKELKNSNSKYFIEVLSNKEEARQWWAESKTGDSLFRENQNFYDNMTPVIKITKTLDSIVSNNNLPLPDLIKIDVQGAELEVLQGGTRTLGSTSIIILELPILEYNLGAPKISEILDFMKENDFIPVELLEIHKAGEFLVQLDIGFVKRSTAFEHYDTQGKHFL